ncbi:MAG: T9SS type A sorting domain-containing protein [Candidatus Latescibacterota bacterium]
MMKKILAVLVVAAVFASSAFGIPFTPTVMKINAAPSIQYAFDGKTLNIPITVTGTQANILFLLFTKDKAETISKVKNGFMGWHYVNKIDTCVYVSGMKSYPVGSSTISWDGKDENGIQAPAGEYTYYMWGYDGVNSKTMAAWKMTWAHSTHPTFVTHDEKGVALAQPVFYNAAGTQKWTMGLDPLDSLLVETTSIAVPTGGGIRQYLVQPDDYKYFFVDILEKTKGIIGKYERVPNGKSILVSGWGTNEGYSFFHSGTALNAGGGIAIVDDKIIKATYDRDNAAANTALYYLDWSDGSVIKQIDLADRWFSLEDQAAGGQYSGGPGQVFAKNKMVFLSTFNACYREMIDPSIEDTDEFVKWGNDNGDYVGDHNFDPGAKLKWVCFDYNVQPYAYTTHADANLFSSFGAYDMGAVSFGLIAPDGTGLGYYSYVGETAGYKQGNLYCDYGSAYDGIYTDIASSYDKKKVAGIGTWFIGHDSIKGTIGTQIGVKDSAPATFAVAQNTPNPFNPSTTISFTLAKAGRTTVEVFNAAGQKVDTILNANLSAGSHSATWNASKRSAGVYFYTVKNGEFSKTMKMTLLK